MAFADAFRSFPCLETSRLRLRPFAHKDAQGYLEWFSDPEVKRYLGGLACPATVEEAHRFVDNMNGRYFKAKQTICWGIALKETDELIGRLELCRFVHRSMATIAYSLAKPHWGHGYMTEAATAVVAFGLETMNLHRIEATAAPENSASLCVLRNLGFIEEGLLRKACNGNEFRDLLVFSMLKEDKRNGESYRLKQSVGHRKAVPSGHDREADGVPEHLAEPGWSAEDPATPA